MAKSSPVTSNIGQVQMNWSISVLSVATEKTGRTWTDEFRMVDTLYDVTPPDVSTEHPIPVTTAPIHVVKQGLNCNVGQATRALDGAEFALYGADPSSAGATPLEGAITADSLGGSSGTDADGRGRTDLSDRARQTAALSLQSSPRLFDQAPGPGGHRLHGSGPPAGCRRPAVPAQRRPVRDRPRSSRWPLRSWGKTRWSSWDRSSVVACPGEAVLLLLPRLPCPPATPGTAGPDHRASPARRAAPRQAGSRGCR